MNIALCKKSLERTGEPSPARLSSLREAEHTVVVRECLDRCGACREGLIVVTIDGLPLTARSGDELAEQLAALAAEE